MSLRGADHLRHMKGAFALPFAYPPSTNTTSPQPESSDGELDKHIICAKFRRDNRLAESTGPWWRRGSRDAGGSEESRKHGTSGAEPTSNDEDGGAVEDDRPDDHVVIVMKMLDECGERASNFMSSPIY